MREAELSKSARVARVDSNRPKREIERCFQCLIPEIGPAVAPVDIQGARFGGKRPRIAGIDLQCRLVKQARFAVVIARIAEDVLLSLHDEAIGAQIRRCQLADSLPLRGLDLYSRRRHDQPGDLVLNVEDILERAVVMLAPNAASTLCIEKLDRNADLPAALAHRAGGYIPHAQFARGIGGRSHAGGESIGRHAGYDEKVVKTRQAGGDVLCETIGEPALRVIAALEAERQHHHRQILDRLMAEESAGQVRPSQSRGHGCACRIFVDLESVDGFLDVFQMLGAEIFIAEGEPVANLLVNGGGNAHMSGARQRLQPCSDIDAVAAYIIVHRPGSRRDLFPRGTIVAVPLRDFR